MGINKNIICSNCKVPLKYYDKVPRVEMTTAAADTQQYPITELINAINAMNPIVAATGIIVFGIVAGSYI